MRIALLAVVAFLGCATADTDSDSSGADLVAPDPRANVADYPGATWIAAGPGHFVRGRPGNIQRIVIHDVEGTVPDTRDLFAGAAGDTSAHYVVDNDGSILQMVHESDTANHAGSTAYNGYAIGIEHAGWATGQNGASTWTFPEALYEASAKLVASLARKYAIPIDRDHIVGHYQVPTDLNQFKPCAADTTKCGGANNHPDPGQGGKNWDWDGYMKRVQKYADADHAPSKSDPKPLTGVRDLEIAGFANANPRWVVQCGAEGRQHVWRAGNTKHGIRAVGALFEQFPNGDCGTAKQGNFPLVIRGYRQAELAGMTVKTCSTVGTERLVYQVDGEITWEDAAGTHVNAAASFVKVDPTSTCSP